MNVTNMMECSLDSGTQCVFTVGGTKEAAKILFALVHRLCSFYYEKFTIQTKVQGKVYEPKRIHHTVLININI